MTNLRTLLIIVSFLYASHPLFGQSTPPAKIEWLSFQEAVARNQTEPKKIFIDVFTDWCGWCKRMDASTFADSSVVALFNRDYYAVKLDAEGYDTVVFAGHTFVNPNPTVKRSTHQLAAALLNGKMSYPSFVFLNETNQMLTTLAGFQAADKLIPILLYFGEDHYKTMSWEQYRNSQQVNETTQPASH